MISPKILFFIFPIMIFYLMESFFIGLFVNVVWKYILQSQFNIQLKYIHWVFIIWIVKVLLFDVFKVATLVNNQPMFKNNEDDKINEL